MSEFAVHSLPGSPFGRAVLATLEEKGQPWRFVPVRPGTLTSSEHLALHPFAKVPALVHSDFTVYETSAIIRYLDRVLPEPPLTPKDPRQATRMDQVMAVTDAYLFLEAGRIIGFQRIVLPFLLGGTTDEAICKGALPAAERVHAALADLLGDKPFMAGDTLTLADIHCAAHMDFLAPTPEGEQVLSRHPKLKDWLARITARPSFQATTWQALRDIAAKAA